MAAAASSALAASEVGDTGDLPASAQEVGPAGPLSSISGTIEGFGDRDMYKICLDGGKTFSATTTGGRAGFDTQLWLFSADGKGVYANDDAGGQQSTLPANNALTPNAAGVYYLAISAFDVDPVSGPFEPIFPNFSAGVQGPSGVKSISGWSGFPMSSGGTYSIGLTGARSCILPDVTPPAIDVRSPVEGAEFDLGQTVLADYSCADEAGGSGLASCVGDVADGSPLDTSTLGAHHLTVVALDNKSNRREVTVNYSVVDRTDPTVDLRAPANGAEVARGAELLADYSCADAGGSGLETCGGDVPSGSAVDTATLGLKSFSVTARDHAGNETTVSHSYRVVDRTKPSVDLRTPPGGAVYERGAPVSADYSCADDAGGSGIASCTGDVPSGGAIDTGTLGDKSFSVTARDVAGNETTVTHSYRVVDGRAPTIAVTSPVDGGVYGLDDTVVAAYTCADEDGGSGLASCSGDVANGAPLDTSSVGHHSFTVSASDRAGNSAVKTVGYDVRFHFEGFFAPIRNRPAVNVLHAGETVPVQFSLDGNQGREVFATGYPRAVPTACGSQGDLDGGVRTQSPGRSRLRYKPRRDLYVYLWKTDRRWEGSCRQFVLKLDDGSYHRADFRFPGHGHHDH